MNLKDTSTTRTSNALAKKKIYTTKDLLEDLRPRKYVDFRKVYESIDEIEDICDGKNYAIQATLVEVDKREGKQKRYVYLKLRTKRRETFSVFLFGMEWMYNKLLYLTNEQMIVAGKISLNDGWVSFANPMYVVESNKFKKKIETIYSKVQGVSDKNLRGTIETALNQCEEILEPEVVKKYNLMPYTSAVRELHKPTGRKLANCAFKRIVFNDLLFTSLSIMQNEKWDSNKDSDIKFDSTTLLNDFIKILPYELTSDQKKVVESFKNRNNRINMLLQGDVGCGKTVVAMCLMMMAASNDYQSVFIAPRSVLAKQHFEEIKGYAEKLNIEIAYLGGDLTAKEKKEVQKGIKDGHIKIIVGTHACFSEKVEYNNLGVVITDEEHLFGVNQKKALEEKADTGIHSLSMSATPIPRTLLGVLYGDNKEIFEIKEKPAGRKDIITETVEQREEVKKVILEQIKKGHQVYVVCPAIEEDDDNNLISVEETIRAYNKMFYGTNIKIGAMHGKMKQNDIDETIRKFEEKELDILISTTVVEVGVNIPNATLMIIEQAKQFGLASMHQLRGRVGRSDYQSYCYLIANRYEKNKKIDIMCETNDGFKIAEEDMKIRGAGDIVGTKQHGFNKYVDELINFSYIYKEAHDCAKYCIEHNYGNKLMDAYNEHFEYVEEE